MKWLKPSSLVLLSLLVACAASFRSKGGLEPVEGLSSDHVGESLRPRRLALLVGIGDFSDDRWPALKHARHDATALGELLRDPEKGRFDNVEILADPEGIHLARLEEAIDRIAEWNTSGEDTVVLYFSTHGTLARGPDGRLNRFLVTSDTDQRRIRETALRVGDLLDRFERMPSRRKVLILASCHSGSGKSALPSQLNEELRGIKGAFFVRPIEEISQASMVLAACAWGETAREDDKLGHDIYTHFLIEALEGEDQDRDGAVTASEAHAHALARTYYFSQGRQRPQVESTVLGADPIVLTGRRVQPGDPVLFSFLPQFEGMRVSVDGRDKGELPTRLVLSPGSHHIRVTDGPGKREVLSREVNLGSGQRVTVEELVEQQRPHWHLAAHGGYQWFLDADVRGSMVAPAPMGGLSFSRLDFPLKNFETGLDFAVGGGAQDLRVSDLGYSQSLIEISYGVRVVYRVDLEPAFLLVGPRLAGVHLLRRDLTFGDGEQDYFNFSPGLVVQLRWNMWSRITLDIEARLHFFSVHTDEDNLDLGYLDLVGGLGWTF